MTKVIQKSKTIYGLKVRTTNEKEMNPETAKIGALWGGYFAKILPVTKKQYELWLLPMGQMLFLYLSHVTVL